MAEAELQPTYSFTIIARFTNASRTPIGLSRCSSTGHHPIYGVELVDSNRESAYSPSWGCPWNPGFRVAPGETRVDTLLIHGPWGMDGLTGAPQGEFEGRFRLVYEVNACDASGCDRYTGSSIRSNTFTVERSQ